MGSFESKSGNSFRSTLMEAIRTKPSGFYCWGWEFLTALLLFSWWSIPLKDLPKRNGGEDTSVPDSCRFSFCSEFFFFLPIFFCVLGGPWGLVGEGQIGEKWHKDRFRRRFWRRRTSWWMIRAPTTWSPGAKAATPSWFGKLRTSLRICFLITSSTTISQASSASSIHMYVTSLPPFVPYVSLFYFSFDWPPFGRWETEREKRKWKRNGILFDRCVPSAAVLPPFQSSTAISIW